MLKSPTRGGGGRGRAFRETYETPEETFPKFPSVIRVIDISDRNPPITAR